jgi:uncharacterized repeat protein (TIGR01451 family)
MNRKLPAFSPAAALAAALLMAVVIGSAQIAPEAEKGIRNFDLREQVPAATPHAATAGAQRGSEAKAILQRMKSAREEFASRLPHAKIGLNRFGTAPEIITARNATRFLTSMPAAAREQTAREFIHANADVFGLSARQVAALRKSADYQNPQGNLAWVEFRQEINGIPVFQGEIRAALTAKGELFRTIGNLAPGLDEKQISATPWLTAAQAAAAAAASINRRVEADVFEHRGGGNEGRSILLSPGPFVREVRPELVYFPIAPGVVRLAYGMELWQPAEAFHVVVDAADGSLLFRKNITSHQTQPATYHVYDDDSPAPLSPTPAVPGSGVQGNPVSRNAITVVSELPAFDDLGWIPDGGNLTTGNNVDAGLDIDGVNGLDTGGRAVGSPARVFNFSYQPGGTPGEESPTSDDFRLGAVTNVFFWTNRYHDRLYQLGFIEAAGNFQTNNFGRGGVGGDPIHAEVQDSASSNTANFSAPVDGSPGRMQLFLFTDPNPDRDPGLDQEVIIHELTHGLSNRLHANSTGLTTTHAQGMGEGWSDFFARALLATEDEDIHGNYAGGAYTIRDMDAMGTDNYYYGFRRFPYAVKAHLGANGKPHNPLTFADTDDAQLDTSDGAFPESPLDRSANGATQIHNLGEVWALALLEMRARLITRLGFTAGNQRALQLVTDGMKLDPVNPNFLQGLDAILAADYAGFAGEDEVDIRAAFASRGMGFGAETFGTSGVVESFEDDIPLIDSVVWSDASPGGNNDGFAQAGETLEFTIALKNPLGAHAVENTVGSIIGGGSANYGTIAPSATVLQTMSYTVPTTTEAGALVALPIVVTSNFPVVSRNHLLRVGKPVIQLTENFDGVSAPSLPPDWTTSQSANGTLWTTSAASPDTHPNSASVTGGAGEGTSELTTPVFPMSSSRGQIRFRNLYCFNGIDGMVLELKIGTGPFQDILSAGGTFEAGGYNGKIRTGSANPLEGRAGWIGLSGGTPESPIYQDTVVNLPPGAAGEAIQLRWVAGWDANFFGLEFGTVRIDTFALIAGFEGTGPMPSISALTDPVTKGTDLTYSIVVSNNGSSTAVNVVLTDDLPPELTHVSMATTGGGVVGGSGNNRTVTFANLATGQTETVTITATVACAAMPDDVILNRVTVSSEVDGFGTYNSATSTITVSAAPPPPAEILPGGETFPATGGSGSAAVQFPCSAWTAASNADWITVTAGDVGNGDGTVGYSVSPNVGAARTGTLTIAEQTYTVHQFPPATAGGCDTPMFGAAASFPTGNMPVSSVAADFDDDGNIDLAIAGETSNDVAVLMGNGEGEFSPPVVFAAGSAPQNVDVGDLNGDGNPDLVVANYLSENISVLLGDGGGGFEAAVGFGVGSSPRWVRVADLNGDGKPDLAVANGDNVGILLNNRETTPAASASFTAPVNFPTGAGPVMVAVADVNGDGVIDLLTANAADVSVLFGDGDGTFGAAAQHAAGGGPNSVTLADFNADFIPDLAVANGTSNEVSVLLGNGAGGFGAPTQLPAQGAPHSVMAMDLNQDFKPDLIAANRDSGTISLWYNTCDTTCPVASFAPAVHLDIGPVPESLALADFDGDDKVDITGALAGGGVSVLANSCGVTTDLAVTVAVSPAPVARGTDLTYTLTVANNGPADAHQVRVSDTLAAGLTVESCFATGGGVVGGTGSNRTITFPSLAAGATESITLTVQVDCSISDGILLGNAASIGSSVFDAIPGNNSATIETLTTTALVMVAPSSEIFAADGGQSSFDVISPCEAWSVSQEGEWITLVTNGGTGNGPVLFSVDPNDTGLVRNGTITISGQGPPQVFSITQDPVCTFEVGPESLAVSSMAATGEVAVTTFGTCGWTAVSNDGWISIDSGSSGVGNGTVGYSIETNAGPPRSGSLTIAGITVSVSQGANAPLDLTVTTAADDGAGSLRQAILDSNTNIGQINTISFDIPGDPSISLVSGPLPEITATVTVDGINSNGSRVALDGALLVGATGLDIRAPGCAIRGMVITGFSNGIYLRPGADHGVIENCIFGTDATATENLGNTENGIAICSNHNRIGGIGAGMGNIIAFTGNVGIGIYCGTDNHIQNNLIGTNAAGAELGNSFGIYLEAPGNFIGGDAAGSGNTIAHNSTAGIACFGGTGNRFRGNSIHSNGGAGIDLGGEGLTANDPGDGDDGTNNLQNFPVLDYAASSGTHTKISGTLDSAAGSDFSLEFFASPSCDESGNGEGRIPLGMANVTTDGSGAGTFSVVLAVAVADGHSVTATATDASGSTSEFSTCRAVVVLTLTFYPASGVAGSDVLIDGSDFTGADTVRFGDVTAGFSIGSDNRIAAVVPAGAASAAVSVTKGGFTVTSSDIFVVLPDQDGDGISDSFEQEYFDDPVAGDPAGDDDGDGQSNRAEYRAGTDPTDSASVFRIVSATRAESGDVTFLFTSVIGKIYRAESSETLGAGAIWTPLESDIAGTGGNVTVVDTTTIGHEQRFYRVVVVP